MLQALLQFLDCHKLKHSVAIKYTYRQQHVYILSLIRLYINYTNIISLVSYPCNSCKKQDKYKLLKVDILFYGWLLLHLISLCLPFFSAIFTIIKISSCLISLSQINDLMVLIKICNLLLFSVCYIIALDSFMKWQIWILFNKLGPKFKHSTIKYCRSINVQIIELRNHFLNNE